MKVFGINIDSPCMEEMQEFTGRIFLSSKIPVDQCKTLIEAFSRNQIDKLRVLELADDPIRYSSNDFIQKRDLHKRMQTRKNDWESYYGTTLDSADYRILEGITNLTKQELFGPPVFLSPKEISMFLKRFIKGQDQALDELCTAVFQHYAKLKFGIKSPVLKPIMICGPTGCAKTATVSRLASLMECPFIYINKTSLSAIGWKGSMTLVDVLANELRKYNIDSIKDALICIDEVDKKEGGDLWFSQISEFLSLCDPNQMLRIPKTNLEGSHDFDLLPVKDLCIIFMGVHQGIEDICKKRLNINSRIGFDSHQIDREWTYNVTHEDLIQYGYLEEFSGRLGRIITLKPLTEQGMLDILKNAEESILYETQNYTKTLYNTEIRFTDNALRLLCRYASKQKLGFRAVQNAITNCVAPLTLNLSVFPQKTKIIKIDEKYVAEKLNIKR